MAGMAITRTLFILLILGLTGVSACDRSPDKALPTRAELVLSTVGSPAPGATAAKPPVERTTTRSPILQPTPTPRPTPCGLPAQPTVADAWSRLELGCPINPGAVLIHSAYAPFEGGQMLWRGDTDTIYVLYNDGSWIGYPNEWREGDPEFTCGEPDSLTTPVRGFGRVWCDHPDVREALGAATAAEIGDDGSTAQDFVNGTILVAPFGRPFVLVGEDGVWRQVEE